MIIKSTSNNLIVIKLSQFFKKAVLDYMKNVLKGDYFIYRKKCNEPQFLKNTFLIVFFSPLGKINTKAL